MHHCLRIYAAHPQGKGVDAPDNLHDGNSRHIAHMIGLGAKACHHAAEIACLIHPAKICGHIFLGFHTGAMKKIYIGMLFRQCLHAIRIAKAGAKNLPAAFRNQLLPCLFHLVISYIILVVNLHSQLLGSCQKALIMSLVPAPVHNAAVQDNPHMVQPLVHSHLFRIQHGIIMQQGKNTYTCHHANNNPKLLLQPSLFHKASSPRLLFALKIPYQGGNLLSFFEFVSIAYYPLYKIYEQKSLFLHYYYTIFCVHLSLQFTKYIVFSRNHVHIWRT